MKTTIADLFNIQLQHQHENCNHVWEEAVCVKCGSEYAGRSKDRPDKSPAARGFATPTPPQPLNRRETFEQAWSKFGEYGAPLAIWQPPLSAAISDTLFDIRYPRMRNFSLKHIWHRLSPYLRPYTLVMPIQLRRVRTAGPHFSYIPIVLAIVVAFLATAPLWANKNPVDEEQAAILSAKKYPVMSETGKHKATIIAKSNGSVTITFTNCRENDKQHVSCQMSDTDGNDHWVYLPGVKLPPAK